jgi:multidrug efflux pump subunit AcrB
MELKVSFDTSLFIEESIRAVYKTLLEALGLVLAFATPPPFVYASE